MSDQIQIKTVITLTCAQTKAITELITNQENQVLFYAPPGYGKLYTLAYFIFLTGIENFCIVYHKLTFIMEFKEQLYKFFDTVDENIFVHNAKYNSKMYEKKLFIISTTPLETHYNKNIIICDNFLPKDSKIKVISIKDEDEEVKEIKELLKDVVKFAKETQEQQNFILKTFADYINDKSTSFKVYTDSGNNSKPMSWSSEKIIDCEEKNTKK